MSQSKHLLSQSKTDELVSAGLQEVLDVFLPAETHTVRLAETHFENTHRSSSSSSSSGSEQADEQPPFIS